MTRRNWIQGLALAAVIIVSMTVGGMLAVNVGDGGDGGDGGADGVPPSAQTAAAEATGAATAMPVVDASTSSPVATGEAGADLASVDAVLPGLVDRVMPSVVVIRGITDGGGSFGAPQSGVGSGVVLDGEGHILTNYHVVQGADRLLVELRDGTVSAARVVGSDPGNDLAIIRLESVPGNLAPARIGDSDAVRIGESVFAIGTPFGLEFSVTRGIVSGINRDSIESAEGKPIRGMIQTDAAVNPGNSGGPLFNYRGEVIGINTAIETRGDRSFAGVGYAVPASTVLRFLPDMLAGNEIKHAQLGITGTDVNAANAEDFGVETTSGVLVTVVVPGSGADRAGLRSAVLRPGGASLAGGDVITAIDGVEVRDMQQLARLIDRHDVGDEITLTVARGSETLELTATLREWR